MKPVLDELVCEQGRGRGGWLAQHSTTKEMGPPRNNGANAPKDSMGFRCGKMLKSDTGYNNFAQQVRTFFIAN